MDRSVAGECLLVSYSTLAGLLVSGSSGKTGRGRAAAAGQPIINRESTKLIR